MKFSSLRPLGRLVAGTAMCLAAVPASALCTATAQTGQCWEGSFIYSPPVPVASNPYKDLKIRVEFCQGSACGAVYNTANPSTLAFWDGGSQMKMRFAFPTAGTWYWKARCEAGCTANPVAFGGPVTINAYTGTNGLYLNGPLTVSSAGRFIKQTVPLPAGGERALVWVGDTAWAGPLNSTAAQWTNYLNDRVAKGFTVIQVSLPVDWMQTEGQQPAYGSQLPFVKAPCSTPTAEVVGNPMPRATSCWNPTFWQTFDQKIFEANDKGLVVVIVGLMEGVIQNAGNTFCPPDLPVSQAFARNIAARYAGNRVILSPGFDRRPDITPCSSAGDIVTRINTIGSEIAAAVPGTATIPGILVTNHWGGRTQPYDILSFQDQAWLDFQLFQSGGNAASVSLANISCRARQLAACVWNRTCSFSCPPVADGVVNTPTTTKPGINGESIYDNGGAASTTNKYNALNARRTGYFSLFSGAMGYTYGADGLYNWGVLSPAPPSPSTGWSRRSSRHMQYLADVLKTKVVFRSLTPDPSLITTAQPADENKKLVLARGAAGTYVAAYLPDNPSISINFASYPALKVNGRWINPRTGAVTTATVSLAGNIATYNRPTPIPACPPVGGSDPLATCSGEPTSDPCYCTDAADANRGERDWVLVVP
ncbi:MAG: DUF4038 domain-containing protein [Thermoanaerobaculia bacterium]|nr:DUF4038 domain-containing protein [Thermoanaerobaculia bacterium]